MTCAIGAFTGTARKRRRKPLRRCGLKSIQTIFPIWTPPLLALGRAGGSCRTEYRLAPRTDQERKGRERWVAIEGAVVRQADGQPVQLLGVTRDITERKHG